MYLLDTETGHFVSENHSHVAELIQNYDPTLSLKFVPPEEREFNEEFPFAIVHTPGDKPAYVVRRLRTEDVTPDIIGWLYHSDHIGDVNAYVEGLELVEKLRVAKLRADEEAAKRDFVVSVLNGKNFYKHNGVKYS